MSNALLAFWVMLIGADRIDLAGGHGAFIVTPFLALTPVVVFAELLRRHQRSGSPSIHVTRRALGYALTASALVSLVLVSVFVAADLPVSASRAALLVVDIGGTFAIALLAADRDDLAPVLAKGAIASLALFALFDLREALWWFGRAPEIIRLGTISIRFGALQNAGPLPRLAGPVADANRAGFVLLFYLFVIAAGERRAWLRRGALAVAALFLACTVSRSAGLGAVSALAVAVLLGRARLSPVPLLAGSVLLVLFAGLFLTYPEPLQRTAAALSSPVLQRLSPQEGSAQGHLELLSRGVGEATASVPKSAIGLGYGNSYLVLQDIFPGNRYGNFHSLYVTMFAESGVLAFVLTLVLMVAPLFAGGEWRTLVAGAIGFNLFYQTTTEPAFWFTLAAAWLAIPLTGAARGRR